MSKTEIRYYRLPAKDPVRKLRDDELLYFIAHETLDLSEPTKIIYNEAEFVISREYYSAPGKLLAKTSVEYDFLLKKSIETTYYFTELDLVDGDLEPVETKVGYQVSIEQSFSSVEMGNLKRAAASRVISALVEAVTATPFEDIINDCLAAYNFEIASFKDYYRNTIVETLTNEEDLGRLAFLNRTPIPGSDLTALQLLLHRFNAFFNFIK